MLALIDASEMGLNLDQGHDMWRKIQVHLKIDPQISQLIHNKSNNIYFVAMRHMRNHISIMTSNLVLVATLGHESDSCNFIGSPFNFYRFTMGPLDLDLACGVNVRGIVKLILVKRIPIVFYLYSIK